MLVTQGKPKRPMNSYMHFAMENRTGMTGMSVAESTKVASSEWKAMSEQQRAPYEKKAADEKVQYEKDIKRWTNKMEKKGLMEAIEVAKSRVSALKKE
jgi:upstream-binding transcription factor